MMSGALQIFDRTIGGAPLWLWLSFHLVVFTLLGADFLLTRGSLPAHAVERRSYWLTGLWVGAALLFALLLDRALSRQNALEYITGYGIEESLSIDNLFVFLILFRAFRMEPAEQRRVLFFGVIGAIGLRAAMIFAGLQLLDAFAWMNYMFGAVLLYTAWRLLRASLERRTQPHSEQPPRAIAWLMRRLPTLAREEQWARNEARFFVRQGGRLRPTKLFVALIAIEATDLVFATDSVPAVLAVSHHPFVVYSSNIFAVVGLRSLYFSVSAALNKLHKLRYGLAAILAFVGLKMMLARVFAPPVWISLAFVVSVVAITTIWSLLTRPASAGSTLTRS